MQFLDSCSQKDPSSDDHQRVKIPQGPRYQFSQPVGGLICRRHKYKVAVGNPSTGQFLTLPRVKGSWGKNVVSFFGYDPVNDVYKVLCMTLSFHHAATVEQSQVLSIGGGGGAKQTWKMLKCNLGPHRPVTVDIGGTCTNGICINGVVYYVALFSYMAALVIFDLKSEEFKVCKMPKGAPCWELVNYNGKVALGYRLSTYIIDVWVLEEANQQKWSKTCFLVPISLIGLDFKGTLSTGEIILATPAHTNPFYLVYYDSKEDNAKKVVIEGIRGQFSDIRVYPDHVESPMFLSKLT